MKKRLAFALASSALLAGPALAQYRSNYYQYSPNYGGGSIQTPYGTYNHQRQNLGNFQYDNFNGPGGSVRCTTQYIGNQVFQNCQ